MSSQTGQEKHLSIDTTIAAQVFVRLASIYGERFSRRFADANQLEAAKIEWTKRLQTIDKT